MLSRVFASRSKATSTSGARAAQPLATSKRISLGEAKSKYVNQATHSHPGGCGGEHRRGRVTGVALTELIAARAAERGWSMFLLGAAPGVAERAAEALQHKYPGLRVVGCYSGSPRRDEEPVIRARIIAAQPTVLLVAYGHPAQELWIARNQPLLRVPVAIGVGGVFDYLAGEAPRAPAWMRRIGLEWLYRLIRQPQRWRRILVAVPLFLWAALREGHPADEQR